MYHEVNEWNGEEARKTLSAKERTKMLRFFVFNLEFWVHAPIMNKVFCTIPNLLSTDLLKKVT